MFFVVNSKIYLNRLNSDKKLYPEVVLVKDDNDNISVKISSTKGIETKPRTRQVCTLQEIIAQFGHKAVTEESLEKSMK